MFSCGQDIHIRMDVKRWEIKAHGRLPLSRGRGVGVSFAAVMRKLFGALWGAGGLAILLVLLGWAAAARADITGSVEQVGFDQTYRPGCWTPMVVRVVPDASTTGAFQIRVEQEDLDKDIVSYVRNIALTAGQEGEFIVYFLPQGTRTIDGIGLPDARDGNLEGLNNQLKVWVCDAKGRKLAKLPIRSLIRSVDPKATQDANRGTKLVLYVRQPDALTTPAVREFDDPVALHGVMEDVVFVPVNPRYLPTSSLGYEGVDAIVWAAGGPPDATVAGEAAKYTALRDWVTGGGRLVVMQHGEWRRTSAWGDMLPVTFGPIGQMQGTAPREDLMPLREMAGAETGTGGLWSPSVLKGPHLYGVASAKPNTVVERELTWPGGIKSAYLARQGVGAGCVTYVAQDLGSRLLSTGSPPPGWAKIWSKVLDYKSAPLLVSKDTPASVQQPFASSHGAYELGVAVLRRMDLTSRAGALVAVTVVFFILYWLAAGPGVWAVLRLRGKREWSWVGFGAVAAAATLVTVAVVRLVLRGAPEMRHFTVVRAATGEPALVQSRMGLYVPRDGDLTVELPIGSADHAAAIAPYAVHPYHMDDSEEFPAYRRYDVMISDVAGDEGAKVAIPFRSTLKRIESTWRGQLQTGIGGAPAILPPNSPAVLTGVLTNNAGRDLKNVYLTFTSLHGYRAGKDYVLYLPQWKDGEQIKLDDATNLRTGAVAIDSDNPQSQPDGKQLLYGTFTQPGTQDQSWDRWLFRDYRVSGLMMRTTPKEDAAAGTPRVWPMLSLFDRLPPMRNDSNVEDRADLLRINARFVDCSAAVSAGRLVVVGEARDVPLPAPIKVDGDEVGGAGITLYQFVVALDRSGDIEPPDDDASTQPTTKSSTRSTTKPAGTASNKNSSRKP